MEQAIIRIQNLSKWYGHNQVLSNIGLEVMPGQIIGYIGPNGAGKSTTVKVLCGLIDDFEGDVFIKNMNMRDQAIEIKRSIGYIPEMAEMYEVLSPYEFLHFMGNLYHMEADLVDKRVDQMMHAFDISKNKFDRMDTFSKGMRQKVLIISGLLHNPDILFLDEPLSGLDANSVIIVKDLIRLLADQGKTIFYCSHLMDIVEKISDRIILIDQGRIIADGTLAELRAKNGGDNLEQIFARFTGKDDGDEMAQQITQSLQ